MLQMSLNGPLTKADHPAVPMSLANLVQDAVACIEAVAKMFHVHQHDDDGSESLNSSVVNRVVSSMADRWSAAGPV